MKKRSHKKEVLPSNSPLSLSPTGSHSLAFITRLRDRSEREQQGRFVIEGVRSTLLALEVGGLELLFYDRHTPYQIHLVLDKARAINMELVPLDTCELLHCAQTDDPQGVIGIASRRIHSLQASHAYLGRWIALESIRKPGNLGSMLRTAEAAGVQGVIAIGYQIDFFSPTCLRASMGSIWGQTLVRCSWQEAQEFKAHHGIRWIGSAIEKASPFDRVNYPPSLWLWMGDERTGLSTRVLRACDACARIPMQGRVDSLNVGVATAILLYEMRRGHRRKR